MTSDTTELIGMLHKMILIREFDELAIRLRTGGKIYGAVHPYVGQEAVAVGVCAMAKGQILFALPLMIAWPPIS